MRLGMIAILVPDYEAGLAFFVDGLGFACIEDRAVSDTKRWVVVEPPSGGASLLLARAVGAQRTAIGNQAGGRVGFFLYSDDFNSARLRIEASGGVFEEEMRSEPYGQVAVFKDPFGNRWDLIQPR